MQCIEFLPLCADKPADSLDVLQPSAKQLLGFSFWFTK